MTNAKNEFLNHIKNRKLVCARIGLDQEYFGKNPNWVFLKNGFTTKDFDLFCEKLNFEYDEDYGAQELFGVILFEDSFSERVEYDGSEWWKNHKMPTIEEVLTP